MHLGELCLRDVVLMLRPSKFHSGGHDQSKHPSKMYQYSYTTPRAYGQGTFSWASNIHERPFAASAPPKTSNNDNDNDNNGRRAYSRSTSSLPSSTSTTTIVAATTTTTTTAAAAVVAAPTATPGFFFGLSNHPQEIANRAADDAFWAWHEKLCRTPGRPLPARRAPAVPPRLARVRNFVHSAQQKWGACRAYARSWGTWFTSAKDEAEQKYKRTAFAAERKYWLALTAYRQSPWPRTLRHLRNLVVGVLVLALVLWLAWAKVLTVVADGLAARENGTSDYYDYYYSRFLEQGQRQQPGYLIWSVTPLRCACDCDCSAAQ
ncbi:hypothetical protein F4811DRAFT_557851 [Daldinia bambusicola]|nr:hypothetical protein F4811DRAFT_557851 [Daldinia bambusicola]